MRTHIEDPIMLDIIVHCSHPGCQEVAVYKLAAPWSDGRFSELKTFGLACPDHIGAIFRASETRWRTHQPGPGEMIDEIGIFKLEPGKRDRQLQRLWGLEENYRTEG